MIIDPWNITGLDHQSNIHKARFNPLDRLDAKDPDLAGDAMLYEQLLLVENLPPIRAKKWWWYRNQTTPENGVE